MLSNREKQPIYTALRDCIGELERLLVNGHELEAKRHGTSVDLKKIKQGYQLLIKSINDAYDNTKNSDEEDKKKAFFDSSRHKALLKKSQNMLQVFFHPNFENFSKFQLINHPLYTDKESKVTVEEFDKKIFEINKFIVLKLEEIIIKNKQLFPLKADIKCLSKEKEIFEKAGKTGL